MLSRHACEQSNSSASAGQLSRYAKKFNSGNAKNLTFKIDNSDGMLTSEQVVRPTRRLDFDDLLIFRTDVNTMDKLKDDKNLRDFNTHTTEVETLVESCCLHLRVSGR